MPDKHWPKLGDSHFSTSPRSKSSPWGLWSTRSTIPFLRTLWITPAWTWIKLYFQYEDLYTSCFLRPRWWPIQDYPLLFFFFFFPPSPAHPRQEPISSSPLHPWFFFLFFCCLCPDLSFLLPWSSFSELIGIPSPFCHRGVCTCRHRAHPIGITCTSTLSAGHKAPDDLKVAVLCLHLQLLL